MSADFAQMSTSGRLTGDPKLFKVGETQKAVFSVAVNRFFKKKGDKEPQKKTTFIDCVAWGRLAERVTKTAKKGVKVALTGDWETDSYEKDNKEVKRSQINVRNLVVFSAQESSVEDVVGGDDSEDVPF